MVCWFYCNEQQKGKTSSVSKKTKTSPFLSDRTWWLWRDKLAQPCLTLSSPE